MRCAAVPYEQSGAAAEAFVDLALSALLLLSRLSPKRSCPSNRQRTGPPRSRQNVFEPPRGRPPSFQPAARWVRPGNIRKPCFQSAPVRLRRPPGDFEAVSLRLQTMHVLLRWHMPTRLDPQLFAFRSTAPRPSQDVLSVGPGPGPRNPLGCRRVLGRCWQPRNPRMPKSLILSTTSHCKQEEHIGDAPGQCKGRASCSP